MPPPRPVRPLARWSTVVAVGLIGVALVTTAWLTRASVHGASATLLAGQAQAVGEAVRADLAELDSAPTAADLAAVLTEHAGDGLRFVALIDPGGHVVAEAGGADPGRPRVELRSPRRGWVGPRPAPLPRGRPGPPHGPGWRVVIELEPVEAEALAASANRTFAIGTLVAVTLLVVAAAMVRGALKREAAQRTEAVARERDRRLAGLGQLSAVLAHEIRNPLASLKGNAQLLMGMLADGDKPARKAARVVEEAIRLEALVEDLLDYARTGELRRRPVDPAALLRESAAAVTTAGGGAEAPTPIAIADAGAPPTWSLDPERIRQVLINLIGNAIEAGAPVRAAVTRDGDRLVFEIQDAGAGIAPDERDRIFEPFFTKKVRGTGLGLAVARRVVEQHGGALSVGNAAGGGAIFRVELPAG